MLIGYARVSTIEQDLALQTDALKKAGCEYIFDDTVSGATTQRSGLTEALSYVRKGDMLIVWRLDRLGRSLKHLIETIARLEEGGFGVSRSRLIRLRVAVGSSFRFSVRWQSLSEILSGNEPRQDSKQPESGVDWVADPKHLTPKRLSWHISFTMKRSILLRKSVTCWEFQNHPSMRILNKETKYMSGELEDIVKLFKESPLLALDAAQGRHSDEEKYGFPEAWKARLPNMVAHAIPSEVLYLIEELNTTELALSEHEAKQLLIETYENGARSTLASIPLWEQRKNFRMVEAQRKSAEADKLRAEGLWTGKVTLQQTLEARKIERAINNPKYPDNHYLNIQKNHYLESRVKV